MRADATPLWDTVLSMAKDEAVGIQRRQIAGSETPSSKPLLKDTKGAAPANMLESDSAAGFAEPSACRIPMCSPHVVPVCPGMS